MTLSPSKLYTRGGLLLSDSEAAVVHDIKKAWKREKKNPAPPELVTQSLADASREFKFRQLDSNMFFDWCAGNRKVLFKPETRAQCTRILDDNNQCLESAWSGSSTCPMHDRDWRDK